MLFLHPSQPQDLTVTGTTADSASLSWTAVTVDGGISEYRIYRDGVQVGTSTTTTYTDDGLTASTSYEYQVTAVATNGGTESEKSTAVTATTTA